MGAGCKWRGCHQEADMVILSPAEVKHIWDLRIPAAKLLLSQQMNITFMRELYLYNSGCTMKTEVSGLCNRETWRCMSLSDLANLLCRPNLVQQKGSASDASTQDSIAVPKGRDGRKRKASKKGTRFLHNKTLFSLVLSFRTEHETSADLWPLLAHIGLLKNHEYQPK